MARLIELTHVKNSHGPVSIRVGDVLLISASGGLVQSGSSIELGGPYIPATAVGSEVLTAMGGPHTMLAWARQHGPATLEIVTGDPWQETEVTVLHISVEE
ncbi:MAG TPA: hypothetical protein VGP76_32020 [Planctomycetaceae bacterium]|jgi:hypothetical protein|nr:hypothetical protein [Planctomycetaceae bacterium]